MSAARAKHQWAKKNTPTTLLSLSDTTQVTDLASMRETQTRAERAHRSCVRSMKNENRREISDFRDSAREGERFEIPAETMKCEESSLLLRRRRRRFGGSRRDSTGEVCFWGGDGKWWRCFIFFIFLSFLFYRLQEDLRAKIKVHARLKWKNG